MNKLIRTGILALAISAFGVSLGPAIAADYKIDLSHSFIQFKVKHLGFSWLLGRFNKFSGDFSYDPTAGQAEQKISIEIDTADIDSNWPQRDGHLRSPDFLDVKKYPKANFASTSYKGGRDGGMLEGDLTLHGVTKKISFPVKFIAEGNDPWGGYRAGFEGRYEMDRRDFGIDFNLGPAANIVHLELYIEGIRQ